MNVQEIIFKIIFNLGSLFYQYFFNQNKKVLKQKTEKTRDPEKFVIKEMIKRYGQKLNNKINIFGVRLIQDNAKDTWNDYIGLMIKDESVNEFDIYIFKATTDPGQYFFLNEARKKFPFVADGVASMNLGFYKDIYQVGLHKGYRALRQDGSPVSIRRIKKIGGQFVDGKTEKGLFGINLHHGFSSDRVGLHSAGCQVIRYLASFKYFMDLIYESDAYRDNNHVKFSYYLFDGERFSPELLKCLDVLSI